MRICIDAGHNYNGADTGTIGAQSREQDNTFEIASRLSKILKEAGHSIKLTRLTLQSSIGDSELESLNSRAQLSNSFSADLFVSIHCNASLGHNAVGAETHIIAKGGKAEEYAKKVQAELVSLGRVDRGVKVSNLLVLRKTSAPAILVEVGFLDVADEEQWILDNFDEIARAIAVGIDPTIKKEGKDVPLTVQKLTNIFIQEIYPPDFGITVCDYGKKDVPEDNYFNLGFFGNQDDGTTVPVGNLAADGKIITQSKDNPSWINLSKKMLTTLYVKNDGTFGIEKTDTLEGKDIKTAVSGIPIVINGKPSTMDEVKAEGYTGSELKNGEYKGGELYYTWHGFLGYRGNDLVYVAAECDFGQMPWILIALGIRNAIKLDGGGSFILHNGKIIKATDGNRPINNVGTWRM